MSIFALNEYYNTRLEQKIAQSLFAAGGIKSYFITKKLRQWLKKIDGVLLDVGSGEKKWEHALPSGSRYITLDYLPTMSAYPWRKSFPDINGDALALPFQGRSIDAVVNVNVLEHVNDPVRVIQEISRTLKPGGLLLLVGPGDITYSHGDPYMFFNLTRHAYRRIFEESHLHILEEYFPSKTFVSVANIIYMKLVRNRIYNRNRLGKYLQIPIFLLSLILSPFLNIGGLGLDLLIPFDKRGYDTYMDFAQKSTSP